MVYAEGNMDRWLLEHDKEGEVYTRPHTTKKLITEVLESFNGSTIFYCCLFDTTDEAYLCCFGEPERRVIEGRIIEDGAIIHFVVSRKVDDENQTVVVKHGMQPDELVKVKETEVLTPSKATAIFISFYSSKSIPDEFIVVRKPNPFAPFSFMDRGDSFATVILLTHRPYSSGRICLAAAVNWLPCP